MTRRASTFVPKRPHKKSRTGCQTCKTKKVKCDEAQPSCSYCSIRGIQCVYPPDTQKRTSNGETPLKPGSDLARPGRHSNSSSIPLPALLVPVTRAVFGDLSRLERQLLHDYHGLTWRTLTLRNDQHIHAIHQNMFPQIGLSHSCLLFAILSITAAHRNHLQPSTQSSIAADVYRQKTIVAYNRALSNINSQNYESLLTTSMVMQCLLTYPELSNGETILWEWLCSFLSMQQGLRILATMKWGAMIPHLTVAPVFQRELKPLPPAPSMASPVELCFFKQEESEESRELTPELPQQTQPPKYASHPTPPESPESSSYDQSQIRAIPMRPHPISPKSTPSATPPPGPRKNLPFLPAPLLSLLETLTNSTLPPDPAAPILLSALYPLPCIFLSLYHFRLCPDLYTRISTWPPFLSPDFVALVRQKEPRSLIILAWWFALVKLIPNMWWLEGLVERVMAVIVTTLNSWEEGSLGYSVQIPDRVVKVCGNRGREEAAKEFWKEWDGVKGWEANEAIVLED